MTKDPSCIFCKIVAGEIPADIVKQGDGYVVIRDINPQAPTHLLIIPKEHQADIGHIKDSAKLGKLFQQADELAKQEWLHNGFRLVVNSGDDGGQTVHHLHIHLLGGRRLHWPPG